MLNKPLGTLASVLALLASTIHPNLGGAPKAPASVAIPPSQANLYGWAKIVKRHKTHQNHLSKQTFAWFPRLTSRAGGIVVETKQEPSQHSRSHKRSRWIPMIATWYDGKAGLNGTGTGITASGAKAVYGTTIAVDPKIIPFGSIIEVKFSTGKKHFYIAQDTGGAIVGDRVDIFNPSQRECVSNGVQAVKVRVIRR